MADSLWFGMGFECSYRFMRVDRKTGLETAMLDNFIIDGASIDRDDDSSVKESGTASFVGHLDIGADLVRVWLDAFGDGGADEHVPLGTFVPLVQSRSADGPHSIGKVKLVGRLTELSDDQFLSPVTIKKGANAVEEAAKICRGCGLQVSAQKSSYKLGAARVYGIGGNGDSCKLDAVNDLLSLAGFRDARTDGMGTVMLTKTASSPVLTFEEGLNARFMPDVEDTRDISGVSNAVKVTYETQGKNYIGLAVDKDPASEFSTVARGRVIAHSESLTDVPDGASAKEIQKMADARAAEVLASQRAIYRKLDLTHIHMPIWYGDQVDVLYPSAGVSGRYTVSAMRVTLCEGATCDTELRRYER